MKKILVLAIGMLLVPFTAFGMQMMAESEMDSITGQSGVAISLENIQVYSYSEGTELWYRGGSDGAVGIVYGEDSFSYLFIDSVDPESLGGQRGTYSALADLTIDDVALGTATELTNDTARLLPAVLDISVQEHTAEGMFFGSEVIDSTVNGAYIQIGLPTLEIVSAAGNKDELKIYVAAEDADNPLDWTETENQSLGTIYTSDGQSTTTIFGGGVGITSRGAINEDNLDFSF